MIIGFIVGVVASGVFSYLFLRANPEKDKVVSDFVDKQSDKLKK